MRTEITPNMDIFHTLYEPQAYQLGRLTEYENIYLMKMKFVKRLSPIILKRFRTIATVVDIGLITSTFITEGVSAATF